MTVTNQNYIREEIKARLNSEVLISVQFSTICLPVFYLITYKFKHTKTSILPIILHEDKTYIKRRISQRRFLRMKQKLN